MARWRQDSQQFAPWHYRAYALVESHGKVGPPTAEVREFLHDFPVGYTAGSPERERCKQLGNSWHLPTSRFILFVLLFSAQVLQVWSSSQPQWYTQLPSPTFEVRYHPEGSRPLLRACSWWRRAQLTWDPNECTHGPLVACLGTAGPPLGAPSSSSSATSSSDEPCIASSSAWATRSRSSEGTRPNITASSLELAVQTRCTASQRSSSAAPSLHDMAAKGGAS